MPRLYVGDDLACMTLDWVSVPSAFRGQRYLPTRSFQGSVIFC